MTPNYGGSQRHDLVLFNLPNNLSRDTYPLQLVRQQTKIRAERLKLSWTNTSRTSISQVLRNPEWDVGRMAATARRPGGIPGLLRRQVDLCSLSPPILRPRSPAPVACQYPVPRRIRGTSPVSSSVRNPFCVHLVQSRPWNFIPGRY